MKNKSRSNRIIFATARLPLKFMDIVQKCLCVHKSRLALLLHIAELEVGSTVGGVFIKMVESKHTPCDRDNSTSRLFESYLQATVAHAPYNKISRPRAIAV